MILSLLGLAVGGAGIVSGCAGAMKAKKEQKAAEAQLRKVQVRNKKLEQQTAFFDGFRELDNRLGRMIRRGYKGVAYLAHGLVITHGNQRLINALTNIRNYRNSLTHDKRKWKDFPAPTPAIMQDLRYSTRWVDNNENDAARLVWKGAKDYGVVKSYSNQGVRCANDYRTNGYRGTTTKYTGNYSGARKSTGSYRPTGNRNYGGRSYTTGRSYAGQRSNYNSTWMN